MAEIVWTEPALNDLDKIAEYIAVSNLVAAKKLVKEMARLRVVNKNGNDVQQMGSATEERRISGHSKS